MGTSAVVPTETPQSGNVGPLDVLLAGPFAEGAALWLNGFLAFQPILSGLLFLAVTGFSVLSFLSRRVHRGDFPVPVRGKTKVCLFFSRAEENNAAVVNTSAGKFGSLLSKQRGDPQTAWSRVETSTLGSRLRESSTGMTFDFLEQPHSSTSEFSQQ